MADPTVFQIPRRRMLIAPYFTPAGVLPALRDVGVIDSAEVSFEVENNEYRATDLSTGECREYVADANLTSAVGTLTVDMMSAVAKNLAVSLKSGVVTVAAGTAPEETCDTVAVGDAVRTLMRPDPDTLVVTDSDAGPSTLVEGTDYEWVAKKDGTIRFLDLASYVQPFILNYDNIEEQKISPMSSMNDWWYVVFSGGNERNSCGGEGEEFYRVRISESQTKRLHENAETRTPQPMSVGMSVDRDPSRDYEFGDWRMAQ